MTEKILTILFAFISSLVAATGYVGITLLMAIESACIPLPSELIMPFAGYLVYTGAMKLLWVATAGRSDAISVRWSLMRLDVTAGVRWWSDMGDGF